MYPYVSEICLREFTLLEAARGGDEGAFRNLTDPHRRKLHAHCCRMLASRHDADDALQETLVRAWRGLPKLDGRTGVGAWLFRIATNVCLDALSHRQRLIPPVGEIAPDLVPVDRPAIAPSTPASRYEQREEVEMALVAAWQHLPANQRAALILSDVLGYSAREAAERLETTAAAVTSALQRARRLVAERLPDRHEQVVRSPDDAQLDAVVTRCMRAMERADVEEIVSVVSEDTGWAARDRCAA